LASQKPVAMMTSRVGCQDLSSASDRQKWVSATTSAYDFGSGIENLKVAAGRRKPSDLQGLAFGFGR